MHTFEIWWGIWCLLLFSISSKTLTLASAAKKDILMYTAFSLIKTKYQIYRIFFQITEKYVLYHHCMEGHSLKDSMTLHFIDTHHHLTGWLQNNHHVVHSMEK